jgi:acyl carrier protein
MTKLSEEEVFRILEESLSLESGEVNSSTTMEDLISWDSLGHLNILVALDLSLDGKVAQLPGLASANSVEKILSVLQENSLLK